MEAPLRLRVGAVRQRDCGVVSASGRHCGGVGVGMAFWEEAVGVAWTGGGDGLWAAVGGRGAAWEGMERRGAA